MPIPEFVVADAPHKVYPGGVIALRCSDWMAAARGTLTSGADARTVTGTVVSDTQGVSGERVSAGGRQAMHEAADDTLLIDLADVPVEVGMRYYFLISFLFEGNWNTSVTTTFKNDHQFSLERAAALTWWGDSGHPLETSAYGSLFSLVPRLREGFVIGQLGVLTAVSGTEVLHVRGYSDSDASVTVNLDQIYLVPRVFSGTVNGWSSSDFSLVGPNAGFSSTFDGSGMPEDGTDGGDDNGKFTRMPYAQGNDEVLDPAGGWAGGGDYQQKASAATAENMTEIVPDDFWPLYHSDTGAEVGAHAYSVHGPEWRRGNQWVTEDFDRTLGPKDWGSTPEGFGWGLVGSMTQGEGGVDWSTDGDLGWWEIFYDRDDSYESGTMRGALSGHNGGENSPAGERAYIDAGDHIIFSGQFRMEERAGTQWTEVHGGDLHFQCARVIVGLQAVANSSFATRYALTFQRKRPATSAGSPAVDVYTWGFVAENGSSTSPPAMPEDTTAAVLHGPVNISSWFDWGAEVGFLIEIRRYIIRVKVWDATGDQPAGFDFEGFRPLANNAGSVPKAYPYTGYDLDDIYNRAVQRFQPWAWARVNARGGIDAGMNVVWTSIGVGSDHLNTEPGSIFVNVEQPSQGTEVGEIEIPWGPWQMIYWGARDWTTAASAFPYDSYLDFSEKVWVETGSSDIQRAESLFYYFRAVHLGAIDLTRVNMRAFARGD